MLFVVRFVDKPPAACSDARQQCLQLHLDWLDANRDRVLIAGSLREEPAANPIGGLWIVNADSKEAVESLITSDPFWRNGLRESVEVLHWSKAFDEPVVI